MSRSRRRHTVSLLSDRSRSPTPNYYIDLTVDSPATAHNTARNQNRHSVLWNNSNDIYSSESSRSSTSGANSTIELDFATIETNERQCTCKTNHRETAIETLKETSKANDSRIAINDSTTGETTILCCPICFEYLSNKNKPTSTRCGHVYCETCIAQALKSSKKCPTCQSSITIKTCRRLYF